MSMPDLYQVETFQTPKNYDVWGVMTSQRHRGDDVILPLIYVLTPDAFYDIDCAVPKEYALLTEYLRNAPDYLSQITERRKKIELDSVQSIEPMGSRPGFELVCTVDGRHSRFRIVTPRLKLHETLFEVLKKRLSERHRLELAPASARHAIREPLIALFIGLALSLLLVPAAFGPLGDARVPGRRRILLRLLDYVGNVLGPIGVLIVNAVLLGAPTVWLAYRLRRWPRTKLIVRQSHDLCS